MVHSDRILKYELINSSTTKILMKKVSHFVEAIHIFLNVHFNESGFDSLL